MHSSLLLALLPLVFAKGHPSAKTKNFADPSTVCTYLKAQFGNITLLPTDEGYEAETQVPWDASAWTDPACVFAPTSAQDLSHAIKALTNSSTPFAMRGGGHMPIADAASINSTGVQISSTNLKTMQLSEDRQTMSIGPGPRWGDVFEYLDGTNLTVVGGRLPPVGVPGLLLGGGISYFSYMYGLASSEGKVKAYEVVLADGTITTVTSTNHPDLYWALQGGGSNFAIVTRFDLQTFPLASTLRAEASYAENENTKDAYLSAVLDFTLNGDIDPHVAITPVVRWAPNVTVPSYESTILYNGTIAPSTGPIAAFYNGSIEAINSTSTLQPMSLATYSKLVRPTFETGGIGHGFYQRFHVVSMKATREAMDIVHDTWIATLQSTDIANRIPGFFAALAFNCVTRTFAEKSQGMPMAISPEPQFWVEESLSWDRVEDQAEVERFLLQVNAEIDGKLAEKDLLLKYLYLNDSDKGQPVFEGYGRENVERLKEIRERYDPEDVFTELMPGGWKVRDVDVEECEE